MKPRAGSKTLIREINEALVLDAVRALAPVSRAAIVSRTGLSAATVTGITGRLLQAGLLTETDIVRGTGGRPARLLELGTDVLLAAGVRLSADEAFVALVNLRGKVVSTHREPLASPFPEDAADAAARAVRAAVDQMPDASLTGVGVAISGVVDHAGGIVRHSGSLGWENVAFQARLASLVDGPVLIDSYVNSVASGLLLFDSKVAGRDLLVFSIGTSLGVSVVVRGRIHRGHVGSAGGFAHSRVASGTERPCHCGGSDCLETWSSRWGIEQERERRAPNAGLADELIDSAAEKLGTAMANASKMFGPERIVAAFTKEMDLPDLIARSSKTFRRQYAHENTPAPGLDWVLADEPALARGAAYTVLSRLFTADLSRPGAEHDDVPVPAK